jgi:hypothetical protein
MADSLPPVYGGEVLHVHLDTGETGIEEVCFYPAIGTFPKTPSAIAQYTT